VSTLVSVRDARADERGMIAERLRGWWGTETIISRERAIDASAIGALVAETGGDFAGLATYEVRDDECELVTLNATLEGRGVGTALLDATADRARAAGCARLWLVTSNDNLAALRFYQRRGWRLWSVHQGAIDEARRRKPSIPEVGLDGIPLHDEIVLGLAL
jgi:N-acetylglutamate synthase-like GNAT family acetyltransferase